MGIIKDKNEFLTMIKKDFTEYKNKVKGAQWDLNSTPKISLFIPMPYYQCFHAGTQDTHLPDFEDNTRDAIEELIEWDNDWDFPDTIQRITSIPKVLLDIEEIYNQIALNFLNYDDIDDEDYDLLPLYTESVLLFAAATKTWDYCNRILDNFNKLMGKHFKGRDYQDLFENNPVSEEVYLKRIQDMQPALHALVAWDLESAL